MISWRGREWLLWVGLTRSTEVGRMTAPGAIRVIRDHGTSDFIPHSPDGTVFCGAMVTIIV
jgi:hypothetical protein